MDESRLEIPILIKLIAEASERDVNRQMKDQEVTATQARALGYLSYANQPIPEKKLEKALHISQPSTAGLVHRLQDRGLIATSPCPDDGRSTLVALTEKGSGKYRKPVRRSAAPRNFWNEISPKRRKKPFEPI